MILYTDASKSGWGGYNKTNYRKTGGTWSTEEQNLHINILELKACQLSIMELYKDIENIHVKVFMDNTNSVAYLQNFGGRTSALHHIARDLWLWCIEKNIHLTVAHVPGTQNHQADKLKVYDDTEWSLLEDTFENFLKNYPEMKVGLFALRLNKKTSTLCIKISRLHGLCNRCIFLFMETTCLLHLSSFQCDTKSPTKIVEDKAEAVLVCPI